jgi:hypothetical protein
MECVMAMDYAQGWDQWKGKFKDAVKIGRKFGLSDETIKTMSTKIGDYLETDTRIGDYLETDTKLGYLTEGEEEDADEGIAASAGSTFE